MAHTKQSLSKLNALQISFKIQKKYKELFTLKDHLNKSQLSTLQNTQEYIEGSHQVTLLEQELDLLRTYLRETIKLS